LTIYKRLFAWMYHNLLNGRGKPDLSDPLSREIRLPLLKQARGDVLEIGAGDGSNLPLYPPEATLTLLEPNPYMIAYLRQSCRAYNAKCALIVEGYGEQLPFPDHSFDVVVATHVLCSVKNQARVLAEIRRVLRSQGAFLFLEHVAAPPQTTVYYLQHLLNPVWRLVGEGCHLTRDTGTVIQTAGFSEVQINFFEAGFPAIVSPHVWGIART
jgi:ubiquinone/menaquinone biosynthesis C-methylase UbiE